MRGRFRDLRSWSDLHRALVDACLPTAPAQLALHLEPREQVCLTNDVVIVRAGSDGAEVSKVRWWLVPWFHRGDLKA